MLMLSATQVYTIFTVQLFAFLNLLPVEADITAVSAVIQTGHKPIIQECHLFLWHTGWQSRFFFITMFMFSSVVCRYTVLGYIASVVSKNDIFPSFSTPLRTKQKALRTYLRGLGTGFQQRVWRWVKKRFRSVVFLEMHTSATIANCSYKSWIGKKKMQKSQKTWEFVGNLIYFVWVGGIKLKQEFFLTTWLPANQKWVW